MLASHGNCSAVQVTCLKRKSGRKGELEAGLQVSQFLRTSNRLYVYVAAKVR